MKLSVNHPLSQRKSQHLHLIIATVSTLHHLRILDKRQRFSETLCRTYIGVSPAPRYSMARAGSPHLAVLKLGLLPVSFL